MSGRADAEEFAANIVAAALSRGASAAQARVNDKRYFEIEFNNHGASLVRTADNQLTTITLFRDGKRGAATLNGYAPEAVDAALDAALVAADAGLADSANDIADAISLPSTEHGPQEADRGLMASSIEEFIAALGAHYPLVRTRDASYNFSDAETVFVNSRGLRQKERRTHYGFSTMFMAKDGPRTTSINYTGATAYEPFVTLLQTAELARLLSQSAQSLDRKPVPQKFLGDVIITPECLSGIIWPLARVLSGSALFAGATPYKDKGGEAIASPLFSLSNRPRAPEFPGGADFDGYGVPTRDITLVRDGVLEEFLVDFFYSKKLGVPQTAGVTNFAIAAGDSPLDEIIAGTKRGILFSRFSGGAPNNNLDFSGVAKNSFYIEDGRIAHALEETMVSGNLQELLANIHAVSQEHVNFGDSCYPYIAASGVMISSK